MKKIYCLISLIILLLQTVVAKTFDTRPEVQEFIINMAKKHNFEEQELMSLFNQYKTNQEILQKIANPSEKLCWGKYKNLLLTRDRVIKGKEFLQQHKNKLQQAEQHFGVPKEVITAILGVESSYGAITGKFPVLEALATLAFDYPARQKFFRSELEHFLLLTKEKNLDPTKITGSYAGAMSPAQFISSSYRAYAVDFSGSGDQDLNNMHNAIGSIANYFNKHGWTKGGKIATKINKKSSNINNNILEFIHENNKKEYWQAFNNFIVITKYNNSNNYAMAVYQLAKEFGLK